MPEFSDRLNISLRGLNIQDPWIQSNSQPTSGKGRDAGEEADSLC